MEMRNFFYKKSLGQNFIFDEKFLESIVKAADITENDTVVEIGAGAGTLTCALAKTAKRVIAYELDNRLQPILEKNLSGLKNVELHFADALAVKNFPDNFKLVANIPYYITTPLLMKFIRLPACTEICVLVQEELADRIVATCGTKAYGALSITMQTMGQCHIIKRVPRKMFTPPPNVDSAFVAIRKSFTAESIEASVRKNEQTPTKNIRTKPPSKKGVDAKRTGDVLSGIDTTGDVSLVSTEVNNVGCYKTFDSLVKGVFSARRKTMLNALKQTLNVVTPLAKQLLQQADIDETLRPEQIPPDKFVKLSHIISKTSI